MDNVLIDDRRIHVDFSQSISKFKWKGKGRLEIVDKNKKDRTYERDKEKVQTKGKYSKFSKVLLEKYRHLQHLCSKYLYLNYKNI